MIPSSLQEKMQISAPRNDNDDEHSGWVSAESVQDPRKQRRNDWQERQANDVDMRTFDEMPPGMEIDQGMLKNVEHGMPMSLAGDTDVSHDATPGLDKGYKKIEMKGTDDQYTGEHMDLFYGDAGGFCERNNYLDRL